MKNKTAILVDDEFTALMGLQQKLNKLFPELDIIDTFQESEKALKALQNRLPDILFLDIEMPRITGFELLAQLDTVHFQVIFVTAYNDYVLKALKQSAVGYILKPIDDAELILAVNKALAVIDKQNQNESNSKLIEILTETITNTNKLVVPTAKGLSFVPQEDVTHLEGYEGYTKIHLTNGTTIVSSYNLGKFEKMMGRTFFKCHKSHIINLEKVRSFENEGYIVLENEYRVPISQAHKKAFLGLFKN